MGWDSNLKVIVQRSEDSNCVQCCPCVGILHILHTYIFYSQADRKGWEIWEKPWGGWVGSQIWENFPKKNGLIFLGLP